MGNRDDGFDDSRWRYPPLRTGLFPGLLAGAVVNGVIALLLGVCAWQPAYRRSV